MSDQASRSDLTSDLERHLSYPRTPAHMEPFVDVLGIEGAMAFLLASGGAELILPSHNPTPNGAVATLVGVDKARELGNHRRIPRRISLAKPWLARCLSAQGRNVAQIARQLHVTDSSVRGYLRGVSRSPYAK